MPSTNRCSAKFTGSLYRESIYLLVEDEAVKILGADLGLHRHDQRKAIETRDFLKSELGHPTFTEAQANQFSFNILRNAVCERIFRYGTQSS
jgi:catalase